MRFFPWLALAVYIACGTISLARQVPRDDRYQAQTLVTLVARQSASQSTITAGTEVASTTLEKTATITSTSSVTTAGATANVTATPTTTMPSLNSSPPSTNKTTPANPDGLPIQPHITPALGVGGFLLMIIGAAYALIGIQNLWVHVFLSAALLTSLGVTVLIVYVMSPPIHPAIQGAYLVAVFFTGVTFGGLSIVFKELTEGLGCLLGGFCMSMWLLTLKPGGLLTGAGTKSGFIGAISVGVYALSFSHHTRPYALIFSTSFAGGTVLALGIDCFSRAGLKEFWLYIWDLNDNIFPLNTNTYPITRNIRVELAVIVIACILGIISQLRLWRVVRERRKKEDALRKEEAKRKEEAEEELGRKLEEANMKERKEWEARYNGEAKVTSGSNGDDLLKNANVTEKDLEKGDPEKESMSSYSYETSDGSGDSEYDDDEDETPSLDEENRPRNGESGGLKRNRADTLVPFKVFDGSAHVKRDDESDVTAIVGSEIGSTRSRPYSSKSFLKRMSAKNGPKPISESKEALIQQACEGDADGLDEDHGPCPNAASGGPKRDVNATADYIKEEEKSSPENQATTQDQGEQNRPALNAVAREQEGEDLEPSPGNKLTKPKTKQDKKSRRKKRSGDRQYLGIKEMLDDSQFLEDCLASDEQTKVDQQSDDQPQQQSSEQSKTNPKRRKSSKTPRIPDLEAQDSVNDAADGEPVEAAPAVSRQEPAVSIEKPLEGQIEANPEEGPSTLKVESNLSSEPAELPAADQPKPESVQPAPATQQEPETTESTAKPHGSKAVTVAVAAKSSVSPEPKKKTEQLTMQKLPDTRPEPAAKKAEKPKLTAETVEQIPRQTSRLVLSYRTNEWAKHLANADAPEFDALQPVPEERNGKAADDAEGAPAEEAAVPVNVRELLQTPLDAQPPPAVMEKRPSMSKERPPLSPIEDPRRLVRSLSKSPPPRESMSRSHSRNHSRTGVVSPLAQLSPRSASKSLTNLAQSPTVASQSALQASFGGIRNASSPLLTRLMAAEQPPTTGEKENKAGAAGGPKGSKWKGPPPLLAVRENMMQNRITSVSMSNDPWQSRSHTNANYEFSSARASPTSSTFMDEDNMPLSQRRAMMNNQQQHQARSSPPPPPPPPHAIRGPRAIGTPEATMAAWREAVREELTREDPLAGLTALSVGLGGGGGGGTGGGTGTGTGGVNGMSRSPTPAATVSQSLDAAIAEGMQKGEMAELHREAMRRMQASAKHR
ncbi:hypothetical protein ASPZODRAFT_1548389 [Penicilliopsis zonata CBS 506.65]|uniref:TM7S3/TM198-like domain-containing protein n=1 Tax=Penicilliopsis zonata CBS 506.65 TaxID=1073090 RepID=A0A1L9SMC3_9EURO|nr:hypothetical protein ASPZODRAFT_1548389 [Penicilliopsis zonata CBS 506.65]OJJ48263.1 hypothetical protein ASPZODRAFT_1548389 [Penicilliopsis zonata CBS 506.65]